MCPDELQDGDKTLDASKLYELALMKWQEQNSNTADHVGEIPHIDLSGYVVKGFKVECRGADSPKLTAKLYTSTEETSGLVSITKETELGPVEIPELKFHPHVLGGPSQEDQSETLKISKPGLEKPNGEQPDYCVDYDGADFIFTYQGKKSRVPDCNQVRMVVLLILHSGEELSNLDIWDAVRFSMNLKDVSESRGSFYLLGPDLADPRAIKEVEVCLNEVELHIEESHRSGASLSIIEKWEEKKEKLVDYLRSSRGKNNRPRRKSSIYSRARTTVCRARKRAIERIEHTEYGKPLAQHLRTQIFTGSPGHVVYNPSPKVDWKTKNLPKFLL